VLRHEGKSAGTSHEDSRVRVPNTEQRAKSEGRRGGEEGEIELRSLLSEPVENKKNRIKKRKTG